MLYGHFPHALRRAIRRDEIRVSLFKLLQPFHQPIVVEVGNRRRSVDIVPSIMLADCDTQFVDFLLRRNGHWFGWVAVDLVIVSVGLAVPISVGSHRGNREHAEQGQFDKYRRGAMGVQPDPKRMVRVASNLRGTCMDRLEGQEAVSKCRDNKQDANKHQQEIKRIAIRFSCHGLMLSFVLLKVAELQIILTKLRMSSYLAAGLAPARKCSAGTSPAANKLALGQA